MKGTTRTMFHFFAGFVFFAIHSAVANAQGLPPVRALGPVSRTSAEPLRAVSQIRALPDGRVIVHDNAGRRVVMFDSTLTRVTIIADSAASTGNAYSSRLGGLIEYRGDSTLFVDPVALAMLVIDSDGRIARTMAVPQPEQVQNLIGGPFGTPAFDGRGRLVFRSQIRALRPAPTSDGTFLPPVQPDSALIVRFDIASRTLDTVAKFRIPRIGVNVSRTENGAVTFSQVVNPLPQTDDWAVLADGTVAIVRGQDYRVDFIGLNGAVRSTPRIPFDWQRLTDEAKVTLIDSTRVEIERQRSGQIAGASVPVSAAAAGGRLRTQPDGAANASASGSPSRASVIMPPLQLVVPSELPDYRPAFRTGASRGDADGNLWIRTTKIIDGGAVYDVISVDGALIARVQVPPGRVIAGFGTDGAVYMGVVDGKIAHLERARWR